MLVSLKEIKERAPLAIKTEFSVANHKCVLDGTIAKKEVYTLNGVIQLNATLNCDLCLEKIIKNLNLNIDESLDDEGDEVNIISIAAANVFENLPMQILCSEDCKGICPSCGVNLNKKTCSCKPHNRENAFSKLLEINFENI